MVMFLDKVNGGYVDLKTIQETVTKTAENHGIPKNVFHRLIFSESSYNTNAHNSEYGADGIAQFIPSTARQFNLNTKDWRDSLEKSATYLSKLANQTGGNWLQAVGLYKGKRGGVESQIDYASKKLNQHKLTLSSGEVIEYVGQDGGLVGVEAVLNQKSGLVGVEAKLKNPHLRTGDIFNGEGSSFGINSKESTFSLFGFTFNYGFFYNVGLILLGFILVIFTIFKAVK